MKSFYKKLILYWILFLLVILNSCNLSSYPNGVFYVDNTGKVIIETKYDELGDFHEGFACVKKDGKWGFIDKTGKVVVELKYDGAGDFHEGFACVKKDEKWGFIDKTGKVVIKFKYDGAGEFHGGYADCLIEYRTGNYWVNAHTGQFNRYDTDTKIVRIDKSGNGKVVHDKELWSEGLAVSEKGGRWGFIDKTGKVVIELKYDYAGDYYEGLACVKLWKEKSNDKWGFIDRSGKLVVEEKYLEAHDFYDGFACVKKGYFGKWGFIDKSGKVVLEEKFNEARDFHEGLAAVLVFYK